MARLRRLPVAVVLTALSLTAACGSTVAPRGGPGGAALAPGGSDDGLSVPSQGVPGSGTGSAAGPGGATSGGGAVGGGVGTAPGGGSAGGGIGSPTGGGAGTGGGTGGGSGGGTGMGAGPGPGITAEKIYLGLMYYPDAALSNAAIGADGVDAGDQRDYYNAVIDELNKRGGILGREVAPLYFEFHTASNVPADQQYQEACDHWTKDNKVFAILFRGRVLQECARKAGALITAGDSETGPAFDRLPNLIDPGAVALERLAAATVSGLNTQKYFQPAVEWPTGKVGLISWDDASFKYGVSHGYNPALSRVGRTALLTKYIAPPQTFAAIADASAAVRSAILAFDTVGIDHVLIQDGPAGLFGLGGLTLLVLNNAKSQDYYPRYGFNANNVPGFSAHPADQQHGMLAVDFSDYMPGQDAGIKPNAARERCFAIMKQYGAGTASQATQATASAACDGIWFIEEVLKRAPQPNLQGVLTAVDRLGTAYRSTLVYGTRLGPGRHDGAELARNSRFDDACSCMRFTSGPYAP